MNRDFFKDKDVLVMGLGRFGGGVDCARFACDNGARVTVTDLADEDALITALENLEGYDIQYVLGEHRESDFENNDIIIVNPAVKPGNKFVTIAEAAGKFITSQIELFFAFCPCRIAAITGANGKSTTTALTHHILSNVKGGGYGKVWLGGNIGNRPLLGLLDEIGEDDIVVLEVSSFQTEQLARSGISSYAALITNLTPNHLDWHGSFEEYCGAKENLFSMQTPDESDPCVSIFNAEDEITAGWFEKYHSQKGRRCVKFATADVSDGLKEHFTLAGKMNLSNLAGAVRVAASFGLEGDAIAESLDGFEGLPCRLELVRELGGVRWYNDSISTTPVSTIAAIEAFDEPKILIAGGYDKGLGFDELGKAIAREVKAVILIGATAEQIEIAIGECPDVKCAIERGWSMASAVELAQKHAQNGDVVLMSPACASYDMFANFRQRADVFIDYVNKLVHSS